MTDHDRRNDVAGFSSDGRRLSGHCMTLSTFSAPGWPSTCEMIARNVMNHAAYHEHECSHGALVVIGNRRKQYDAFKKPQTVNMPLRLAAFIRRLRTYVKLQMVMVN